MADSFRYTSKPPAAAESAAVRTAVVGAGWAGLAAAIAAVQRGQRVTLFEAARHAGGRARSLPVTMPDGRKIVIDNGQHILIGAYTHTLQLMRTVGANPEHLLLRMPLDLRYPDGSGLHFPAAVPAWLPKRHAASFTAAWGIARTRGWRWSERMALLRTMRHWQRGGFACSPFTTVADLCAALPARVVQDLIEPLCSSALNTVTTQASGSVFLRVLRDALFAAPGASDFLLPRAPLSELLPEPALRWLAARRASIRLGERVSTLQWSGPDQLAGGTRVSNATAGQHDSLWRVQGEPFDQVILATSAANALALLRPVKQTSPQFIAQPVREWGATTARLPHTAITTVYAQVQGDAEERTANTRAASHLDILKRPMLTLRSGPEAPAQFVFNRTLLGRSIENLNGSTLLAFVVCASQGERADLEAKVCAQSLDQLGLRVQFALTLTEKRATFACTTNRQRPPKRIAPGLSACGDYVEGDYPATLEGSVMP
ncbi:MAG: FAD-dependent oxidoreductase [Burkholderiaceae bacterium]|jgi:squalene-associated FAD-dependent desaturase|nr:FAD-dependent oxidoreductase [Burkholderiaceae bacterium]